MTRMIHSQRTARAWRLKQTNNVTEYTVAEESLDDTGAAERLRLIRERRKQSMEPTTEAA